MYIEFYKIHGYEYARLRSSVRQGAEIKHSKSVALGRVLDKEKLIFRSREDGVFQYDPKTDTRNPPPAEFKAKLVRKTAAEKLIVDFGDVHFFDQYIKSLGLWPVFESVDYGNADTFKALLHYYIIESRSNAHAADWYEGSYARVLYPNALLESPRISDMLKRLGNEQVCRRFFQAYVAYLKQSSEASDKGAILIDSTGLPNDMRLPVTAVSNHNGDISNEVRLIYVVQRGTGLPIYMRYIPGNIVDVSTLLTTIAELKALSVDTKFAILDAGYLTIDGMKKLLEQKVSFLARAKKNWKFYKDLLVEHLPTLESKENLQVFNGRFVYINRIPYTLDNGQRIYCYLGLDDERRCNERRQLAKVAEENEYTSEELADLMSRMGIFMLTSSRRIAVKDLLPLYYTRQDIEQVFDITKGYAKALPLCVQTVETFRGHLLMVFMATIVLRILQQKLVSTPYSLDDILCVMKNQKAKVYDEYVIPCEATRKQNDFYRIAKIKTEISIVRNVVNAGKPESKASSPKNNP